MICLWCNKCANYIISALSFVVSFIHPFFYNKALGIEYLNLVLSQNAIIFYLISFCLIYFIIASHCSYSPEIPLFIINFLFFSIFFLFSIYRDPFKYSGHISHLIHTPYSFWLSFSLQHTELNPFIYTVWCWLIASTTMHWMQLWRSWNKIGLSRPGLFCLFFCIHLSLSLSSSHSLSLSHAHSPCSFYYVTVEMM